MPDIPAVPGPTGSSGYLLLDQCGTAATVFTDLGALPALATSLGTMSSVTVWGNNISYKYMIQKYQFSFSSGNIANPGNYSLNTSASLTLTGGEYITSAAINRATYTYYYDSSYPNTYSSNYSSVISMTLTTSKGQTLALPAGGIDTSRVYPGTKVEPTMFRAPTGWKIVGFRGSTTSYTDNELSGALAHPIIQLGAILAPMQASGVWVLMFCFHPLVSCFNRKYSIGEAITLILMNQRNWRKLRNVSSNPRKRFHVSYIQPPL